MTLRWYTCDDNYTCKIDNLCIYTCTNLIVHVHVVCTHTLGLSCILFFRLIYSYKSFVFFPFNFTHRLTLYANSLLLRPRPGIAHEPLDPTSIKLVHTPSCDTHLHGHVKDDMYNTHTHTHTHVCTLTHDRHL